MTEDTYVDTGKAGHILQAALGDRKVWPWLADNGRGHSPFPVIPFIRVGGRVFYRLSDLEKARKDLEASPLMMLRRFTSPKARPHAESSETEAALKRLKASPKPVSVRRKGAWRHLTSLVAKMRRTLH